MKIKPLLSFLNQKINNTTFAPLTIRNEIRLVESINSIVKNHLNSANSIYLLFNEQRFTNEILTSSVESYTLCVVCVNKNKPQDSTEVAIDLSDYSDKIISIMKDSKKEPIINVGRLFFVRSSFEPLDNQGFLILKIDFNLNYSTC